MDRTADFRALHEAESAFVIPNPWDAGSARMLAAAGFKALATTSGGLAYALGITDGAVSLPQIVAHVEALVEATPLPVSVDLEDGYGVAPETVAASIRAVAEAGASGASIEDWSRDERRIIDQGLAVERMAAAVEAAAAAGNGFVLTARCERLLRESPGGDERAAVLDGAIERLAAYAETGADVVYAPGLATLDEVSAVRNAVARPQNVLGVMMPGVPVADMAAAGAQRISVGGALMVHAYSALHRAAAQLAEGSLEWMSEADAGGAIHAAMAQPAS